jgi:hypothetical protein
MRTPPAFPAILITASLLCGAELKVGAAKTVITPDLERYGPVYIAGFGHNRKATGVHDDLYARCMAFSTGGRPLAICGLDSIGLFYDDVKRVRDQVDGDVVVASTHDHEAPDTMGLWGPGPGKSGLNPAYNDFVVTRLTEAAKAAIGDLRPARVRIGSVSSPELEGLVHDTRPPVRTDAELTVLVAETTGGQAIGTLVNWNNHPEALDSANTLLTADYLAYLHPAIEKRIGGTSVFCNGAVGGMQSPLGITLTDPNNGEAVRQGNFRFAELLGGRVAEIAVKAAATARPAPVRRFLFRETTVKIPLVNAGYLMAAKAGVFAGRKQFGEDRTTTAPVGYIRFDGAKGPVLEIALIPGELYPELSLGGVERYAGADFPDAPVEPAIKPQMKAPYRMLFGLADDEIGYIIPKAEWDGKEPWLQNAPKRWYGESNSVGPEAAPIIAGAFTQLVQGK